MTRKNKIRTAIVSTALIVTTTSAILFAQQSSHVIIDGQRVNVSQPINRNDRLYFPVRELAYSINADVRWDEATRTVHISRQGVDISMTIGQSHLNTSNRGVVLMDAVPFINGNGRTMLPIRHVYESFGFEIGFDENQRVPIATTRTANQVIATPIPSIQDNNNQNQMPSWYDPALHREIRPQRSGGYTIRWTQEGLRIIENEIVRLINIERRISPRNRMLSPSSVHTTEARVRAQEISRLFEHERPNGSPLIFHVEILGRSGGGAVNSSNPEIETAQMIVGSYMNSPAGHGRIVLEPSTWPDGSLSATSRDHNVIGVGLYQYHSGRVFSVVIFDRTD